MNSTKKPQTEARRHKKGSKAALAMALTAVCMNAMFAPSTYALGFEYYKAQSSIYKGIVSNITPSMDISETSGISKNDFVYAMKNCKYDKNEVLADNAEFIWELCQEQELNEFAICGILAIESGWGGSKLAQSKCNLMSIREQNGYRTFESHEECIEYGIKLLADKYINPEGTYYTGGVLSDIAVVYAGPEYACEWSESVAQCAEMCTRALTEE